MKFYLLFVGIVASTGKILYECKINSCANSTDDENLMEEDVLIVRRHQHTIRASEPRSGIERFNIICLDLYFV